MIEFILRFLTAYPITVIVLWILFLKKKPPIKDILISSFFGNLIGTSLTTLLFHFIK